VLLFGGFFVLRIIVATIVFLYILPEGDRCPNCDAVTLHMRSRAWNMLMPWFRTSWCIDCGWDGLLRRSAPDDAPVQAGAPSANSRSQSGQFPLSSKKSSK
jgi:hypothetical protein